MSASLVELRQSGWNLIPVGRDKRPLVSWKAYQDRLSTDDEIRRWQADSRRAIWAGVTGSISGRVTLDFDGDDGVATMHHLGLPPHRRSPRGGFHVDFVHPGFRVPTLNSKSKALLGERFPGMDIRGDGGYINLLGSTEHGPYQWISDTPPLPWTEFPNGISDIWISPCLSGVPLTALQAAPASRQSLSIEELVDQPGVLDLMRAALGRVESGEGRNDAGFHLALALRDHGIDESQASELMQVWVHMMPEHDAHGRPAQYTLDEALASVRSAYSRPPRVADETPEGIVITNRQLSDLTAEAIEALLAFNDPPAWFTMGNATVRIRESEGIQALHPVSGNDVLSLRSRVSPITWCRSQRPSSG